LFFFFFLNLGTGTGADSSHLSEKSLHI